MLVLVALCMLVSAAPRIDFDADEVCENCDQDDLALGPAVPYPEASSLLLEQPDSLRVTPLASLASRFPHPPIF